MTAGHLNKAIEHVRSVLARQDVAGLPDGELLERYFHARDEAAFETRGRRHGPMGMGISPGVLGHPHGAGGAFQATFLVFIRKGSTLRSPGMVGNWLYGVAYRTALEAKKMARKRRVKEAAVMPPAQT